MRIFIILVIVGSSAATGQAQQPPDGPVTRYTGYAHSDCGPSKAPSLRIVLPAGTVPVPTAVPKSAPRPAVELVISAPLEKAVGQKITFTPELASTGLSVIGLSCPVVGDCSRAQSGTLTFERRADDGALTGEFRALWPDEALRATVVTGRFVAAWRECT